MLRKSRKIFEEKSKNKKNETVIRLCAKNWELLIRESDCGDLRKIRNFKLKDLKSKK